jgi:hypothetical protein
VELLVEWDVMEAIPMPHGLITKIQEFLQDGYGTLLNGADHTLFLLVTIILPVGFSLVEHLNQRLNAKKNVWENILLTTAKICIKQSKYTALPKTLNKFKLK